MILTVKYLLLLMTMSNVKLLPEILLLSINLSMQEVVWDTRDITDKTWDQEASEPGYQLLLKVLWIPISWMMEYYRMLNTMVLENNIVFTDNSGLKLQKLEVIDSKFLLMIMLKSGLTQIKEFQLLITPILLAKSHGLLLIHVNFYLYFFLLKIIEFKLKAFRQYYKYAGDPN